MGIWNRSGPALWLTGVAVIAVALVVASIVINMVVDNRDGDLLPEDTAEGSVQRYLRALLDDDISTAYSYMSPPIQEACSLQHFLDTTSYQRSVEFSARLTGTSDVGETKVVSVEIGEGDFDPFGSDFKYSVTFVLAPGNGEDGEGGQWLMSEPPWPMTWCPDLPGDPRSPATPATTPPEVSSATTGPRDGSTDDVASTRAVAVLAAGGGSFPWE